MNAAHFLRLYHQSSKEVVELLKHFKVIEPELPETSEVVCEFDEFTILSKDGVRLLWDALTNSEYLRAALLLQFLKSKNIPSITRSLYYFETQLIEEIINILTKEHDKNSADAFTAASILPFDYLNHFKNNFSIEAIVNLFKNMKKSNLTCRHQKQISLFIEEESKFCEYKQLQDILWDVPNFETVELFINNLGNELQKIAVAHLEANINQLNPELLTQLDLDEGTLETLTAKLNQLKLKEDSENLKSNFTEFFDRLMKSIQTSIRSNEIKIDEVLYNKLDAIAEAAPSSSLFKELSDKFQQITTNKTNIIFTIHRNELAALNSKTQIPIGSRLYLAVKLIDVLINYRKDCLIVENLQILSEKFFTTWIEGISASLKQIQETEKDELIPLIWLSDHLLSIKASADEQILKALEINQMDTKTKYKNQAALLAGIFELEKISTPKLHTDNLTNISNNNNTLLPHFIPK